MNFHFDVFSRMGYEADAPEIQELFLDGKKDEAAAAVPTSLVEDTALIGPVEKIRDDLEGWKESIATTLLVSGSPRSCAPWPSSSSRTQLPTGAGRSGRAPVSVRV